MARRVFFSFHYDDIWRVMQIRDSWVVRGVNESAGFVDKAAFEVVERQGKAAIHRWIDRQLDGTSATVVLIGSGTADREYVKYEIGQSYERGNRLLGIWIDNIKTRTDTSATFEDPIRLTASMWQAASSGQFRSPADWGCPPTIG